MTIACSDGRYHDRPEDVDQGEEPARAAKARAGASGGIAACRGTREPISLNLDGLLSTLQSVIYASAHVGGVTLITGKVRGSL
jgi:hypothetical protein